VELDRRGWFIDATTKRTPLDGRGGAGGPGPAFPPDFRIDAHVALLTVGERYLVAFPHWAGVELEAALATVGAVQEATVVLVEHFRNGYALAKFLSHADETHAAMAVAVVQYAWAWDETEEIVVQLGISTHGVRVVPPTAGNASSASSMSGSRCKRFPNSRSRSPIAPHAGVQKIYSVAAEDRQVAVGEGEHVAAVLEHVAPVTGKRSERCRSAKDDALVSFGVARASCCEVGEGRSHLQSEVASLEAACQLGAVRPRV
jgi:hypothetical protein